MTTTFILGFSSVQFLRMALTFQDGDAVFISQSMKRNLDFDNISVRICMNSIGEKVAFYIKMPRSQFSIQYILHQNYRQIP